MNKGTTGGVFAKLCLDMGLKVTISTSTSDIVYSVCVCKIKNTRHQVYSKNTVIVVRHETNITKCLLSPTKKRGAL